MREMAQLEAFLAYRDETSLSNREKIDSYRKVIRRTAATDRSRSYEAAEAADDLTRYGIVAEADKLIGFGIHIFNEDIYPLQSFEIYLRGCELSGLLDLSGCADLLYVDLYHNRIEDIFLQDLPEVRILGLQDNRISHLDVSEMPLVLGIDAGQNALTELDVRQNPELRELYVNDNRLTEIGLSACPELKYFYCHNNGITALDTTANPKLRHLNAMHNPMKTIRALAPQNGAGLPLELTAGDGGYVGLRFNPVYNAQWKETGEWEQLYEAVPQPGHVFAGWYENGRRISEETQWKDEYGTSRILQAVFRPEGE